MASRYRLFYETVVRPELLAKFGLGPSHAAGSPCRVSQYAREWLKVRGNAAASYDPANEFLFREVPVVLTFDDHMKLGTAGNIVLTPSGGNQANTALTIASNDARITITDKARPPLPP